MSRLAHLRRCAPSEPYAWRRGAFRSGDVFAQSHGGWDSWKDAQVAVVRIATMSTYSHVGVIEVDPEDGHVYAVEAVRPALRRVRLSEVGDFFHLPMGTAEWTRETSIYVRRIVGAPYSRIDAVRAFFSPLPKGTVSECAAATREIMLRAGVDLGPMSRPDSVVNRALELGSSLTLVKSRDFA